MILRALLSAILSLGVYLSSVSPAAAEAVPLKQGTYSCFTIAAMAPQATLPTDLSEVNRAAQGNKIRPMVPPQILLAPAAFGNVILDGKDGYRITAVRSVGKYGFNKATGRPTFTGDLGAMKQGEYNGTGTRFIVGWEGVNYQCSLTADPNSPEVLAAAAARDRDFKATVGPVLPTAQAGDFNARYIGSYICGNTETYLVLDLTAKPDGSLTGVFNFGGLHTPEISYYLGSYALQGEWKEAHFKLKGQQWLKQPNGYIMTDMEGDLTKLGSSGKVLSPRCGSFAVKRVTK
jgi:hypothetical protein